jgi:hypothetical protein
VKNVLDKRFFTMFMGVVLTSALVALYPMNILVGTGFFVIESGFDAAYAFCMSVLLVSPFTVAFIVGGYYFLRAPLSERKAPHH